MQPIDLRTLAGKRYRLAHEHLDDVREDTDPWLLTIPAAKGHFYPHCSRRVGFATNTRGPTAMKLASLPYVQVVQDGSDGLNVVFPPERFEEVAAIVRPHKRSGLATMGPDQKAAAVERLRDYQFQPQNRPPQNEPESTPAA